jgi:flavin reductase (DIM6/NTAB) family NADH-FMN oxidoreductase RutF
MSRIDLKSGALLGPLPAVMVTVGDMERSNVMTAAWCGVLSTSPTRVYISVRPSRFSYPIIKERGEFVINLTTENLAHATDYVGVYTGAKVDKFQKCNLTRVASKIVSAPTTAESPLALECKVFQVIESGTHDIFLADVVNVSCDESIVDEKGRICLDRAHLLAYAHGEYFGLGKRLGRFGFSATKKKKGGKKGGK